MRSKLQKALKTIAKLAKMQPVEGYPVGEAAKDLTEDEAARIGRRLERTRGKGTFVPGKRVASGDPGRNEPCPCKSGKKFKRCHGFSQYEGPTIEQMSLRQFRPGIRYSAGTAELEARVIPPVEAPIDTAFAEGLEHANTESTELGTGEGAHISSDQDP